MRFYLSYIQLHRWFFSCALFFCMLALMAIIAFCLLSSQSFEVESQMPPLKQKTQLPKNPFAQPIEAYQQIGKGALSLKWVEPQMQLPDLRDEVVFLGKNERPDVKNKQLFHLQLKNSYEIKTVKSGERVYLTYGLDKTGKKRSYSFTPGHQPSSLWLTVQPTSEEGLSVTVSLVDDHGSAISYPEERHSFSIPCTEGAKPTHPEIAGCKADASFLVRQKARWIGPDLFLEQHGGEEFAFAAGRQRIDFLSDTDPYACFVKQNDCLIWKEGKWHLALSPEKTADFPLLYVKKIEDKVIVFELWDIEGRNRLTMSLMRIKDYENLPDLITEFKFVGAKTWAQFIVECRGERLIIKPHDWLLYTPEGWHKINSVEEVDAYVSQKMIGSLFVLDKMVKQNGRQALIGHLFNSSRTEIQIVELPAIQPSLLQFPSPGSPVQNFESSQERMEGIR